MPIKRTGVAKCHPGSFIFEMLCALILVVYSLAKVQINKSVTLPLNDEDRKHIMTTVDALLRDAKVRNAHR
jgi:hypothetical protein